MCHTGCKSLAVYPLALPWGYGSSRSRLDPHVALRALRVRPGLLQPSWPRVREIPLGVLPASLRPSPEGPLLTAQHDPQLRKKAMKPSLSPPQPSS